MRLTALYSPSKIALNLALMVIMVAVFAMAMIPGKASSSLVVGLLGTCAFGLWAVLIVAKLFDSREILVIDSYGIFDRRFMDKPIPWSAITGFRESGGSRTTKFFLIDLSEPIDSFIDSKFKRLMNAINRPFRRGAWTCDHSLTVNTSQIREVLSFYLRNYPRSGGSE